MSLVRFDLGGELDELRREVNQIFSTMPPMSSLLPSGVTGQRFVPAMDTCERDGMLHVSMDLPGMDRDDIDVEVHDNVLTIRGSRHIDRESHGDTWYRYERSTGSFERSLQLPQPIDPGQVDAQFDKGELTITVPLPERLRSAVEKVEVKEPIAADSTATA